MSQRHDVGRAERRAVGEAETQVQDDDRARAEWRADRVDLLWNANSGCRALRSSLADGPPASNSLAATLGGVSQCSDASADLSG
jgi:hypothetical protein